MRDVIPAPVFDEIQDHLRRKGNEAENGWESGSDEEDTLTGHLGAQLQRDWSDSIRVNGEEWKWRVRYKKFRGRGPHPFEHYSGADGIVQVEVDMPDGMLLHKGLLFQAKKGKAVRNPKLVAQVRDMEQIAADGSAVFNYRKEGYRASSGSTLLERVAPSAVARRDDDVFEQLGTYLGDTFLPCGCGLRGMYYDAVRRVLIVPTNAGIRSIPIEVRHRVGIDVRGRRVL